MNYHLVSTGEIKYQIGARDPQELADALAQVNKDGCVVIDSNNGYDRQIFTVLGGTSNVKDEDSEDDLDEDTRGIASAFANKAFKRKQSRLIAAKFAEIVS
jgi:hypothetical protein